MAEIEIGIMSRQALGKPLPDLESFKQQVRTWTISEPNIPQIVEYILRKAIFKHALVMTFQESLNNCCTCHTQRIPCGLISP